MNDPTRTTQSTRAVCASVEVLLVESLLVTGTLFYWHIAATPISLSLWMALYCAITIWCLLPGRVKAVQACVTLLPARARAVAAGLGVALACGPTLGLVASVALMSGAGGGLTEHLPGLLGTSLFGTGVWVLCTGAFHQVHMGLCGELERMAQDDNVSWEVC